MSTPASSGSSASSIARASLAASAARRILLSLGVRRHEEFEFEFVEEELEEEANLLSAAMPSTVDTFSLGTSITLFLLPPASISEG